MSATTFARNAKKLFDAVPTLRAAQFVHAANELNELTKCKYLSRLASVDVSEMCWCGNCPIHRDLDALFKCDKFTNLTRLNVHSDRMDATGARKLAACAALGKLQTLDVSHNPFGEAGVSAMLKSKHLGMLTELNLTACELGDAGIAALAKAKTPPALRKLVMMANEFTGEGVAAFVASPLFAQLTHLDLSHNPIKHTGARALATADSALESLDVRDCGITEAAKKALVKRFGKKVKV
jgi:Ran GTPase-activating protein (RanGAP) involved in mRNA processing and transport